MNKFLSLLALASTLTCIGVLAVGPAGGDNQAGVVSTMGSVPAPMGAPETLPVAQSESTPAPIEPPAVVSPADAKPIEQVASEIDGKNLVDAEDIVTAPTVEPSIAPEKIATSAATKPVKSVTVVPVAEPSTQSIPSESAATPAPSTDTVDAALNPQPEPGADALVTESQSVSTESATPVAAAVSESGTVDDIT